MPSPSASLATLRPDLDSSFEEFSLEQDRLGFIGLEALPKVETKTAAGTFGRIPIEQLLQTRDTLRNSRSGYSRGNYKFETDSFATKEHGAEEPIDDNEIATFDEYDVEQYSAQRARDAVLRNLEIEVCTALTDTGVWTGSTLATAISNEWDDFANATPVADVLAAKKKVWDLSGLWPNALIMNRKVFLNLRECAQIIDRIKYSGFHDPTSRAITIEALKQVFDVAHIIVSGSAKNTANKGLSAAISPIWSDEYVMVAKVAETGDPKEPCVGRIFHWGGDGSDIGGTTEEYRDESVRGRVVRVRHQRQVKVIMKEAAHLLSNATT
jgi:hypothetical protein